MRSTRTKAFQRRALTTIAAAATVAMLAGCAASKNAPDPEATSSKGDVLTVAVASAPTSLDPANMEQSTSPFAQPAYDALILEDADGELEPGLATDWQFLDDENKVFEITLREGVTFSDGSELNAEALVKNFEHFDTGTSNVGTLISGGTYEATGPYTVTMTWETPHPLAANSLTQRWVAGMVISAEAIENDPEALATQTAGAGPYVLDADETVFGSQYTYTARDDYWAPEDQHWNTIVIKVVETTDQRLNGLKTGELDYVAGDLTTASAAESAGFQVAYAPTIFVGLSLLDRDGTFGSPLGDVRVRQAINYALDRETVAEALVGEYGFPSEQTVVPSESGYVEDLADHYAFDLDKAKSLLAEAGYPDGFTLPVVASTSATQSLISQVIVEQLAAAGITVELDARPSADYFQGMAGAQFAAAVIGYGSQPMWMEYDGLYGPEAVFNPFGTQRDEIDELSAKAAMAGPDEREEYEQEIQRYLVEEAWFAPMVYLPVFYYASDELAPIAVSDARPQTPLREIRPAG
ncbi:ABC transporter substrate-binding protein [Agromyces laixinhei]|uniref:ABC transporter substrate-binding protein n=1 Tax=Agromyces laixinhei TaxID=2585717 RepID=UPI0012EE9342|nr:ABC transporter substrate-binding protein [Agromyces laixinhei]